MFLTLLDYQYVNFIPKKKTFITNVRIVREAQNKILN